jgi:hypothetical protein
MIVGRFTADATKLREWLPSFLKLYFCNVSGSERSKPDRFSICPDRQHSQQQEKELPGPVLILLRRERGDDFLEA